MNMPFFSVIIPVYNAEAYIEECIQSTLSQEYNNVEIICINDGSTDGSSSILKRLESHHCNVRVFEQENLGPYVARRKGVEKSGGEYLLFLDADDALHPNTLNVLAEKIELSRPDIIFFEMTRDSSFGEEKKSSPAISPNLYQDDRMTIVKEAICEGNLNSLCNKAFSRFLFDSSVGFGTANGTLMGEDLMQLLPLADNAKSILCIDDILYYYRSNPKGSTASYRSSYVQDTKRLSDELMLYARKWGASAMAKARIANTFSVFYVLQILSNAKLNSKEKATEANRLTGLLTPQNANTDFLALIRRPDVWLTISLMRRGLMRSAFFVAKLAQKIAQALGRQAY